MTQAQNIEFIAKISKINGHFTINDLFELFKKIDNNLKAATVYSRIHWLKKRGLIREVGYGIYEFKKMNKYSPTIDRRLLLLHNLIKKKFPLVRFCIWDTKWLNQFTVLQAMKSFIILDVEIDAKEALFHFLQDKNKKAFLEPSSTDINNYVVNSDAGIVVKKLISEAPISLVSKVNAPSIEKIMVDVFHEDETFYAYQGAMMKEIYENIISTYQINYSRLLRYAARKKIKPQLIKYLTENSLADLGGLI